MTDREVIKQNLIRTLADSPKTFELMNL